MPKKYTSNNTNDTYSRTYEDIIGIITNSTNKNDAIKSLSDLEIYGTNVKFDSEGAHKIYDTYKTYNASSTPKRR